MAEDLLGLKGLFVENDVEASVYNVLQCKGLIELEHHVKAVVKWGFTLSKKFEMNPDHVKTAALLHDIGKIVPSNVMLIFCEKHGIGLIKEEVIFPELAHQKISRYLAKQYFDIEDETILSAIGCHSTLRKNAADLDKVLFLADKLSFEEAETESVSGKVLAGLDISLNAGVYVCLKHLMADQMLKIVHPDLKRAYNEIKSRDC